MSRIDQAFLTEIVQTHGGALVLYARQWCGNPDDALQEALVDLLRQDSVPNNVIAWLHVVVRRRAMDLGRRQRHRDDCHRQARAESDRWFMPPGEDAIDRDDCEKILRRLPELEREIVVARIWSDLSFQEIADIVQQPISTVHRRYQQAIAKLQSMLCPSETIEKAQ